MYQELERAINAGNMEEASRIANSVPDSDKGAAFMQAVDEERIDVMDCLIKAGADVNFSIMGKSSLAFAVNKGNAEVVDYLLRVGADTNIVSRDGENVLMSAGNLGHHEVVELLADSAVDIDARDHSGRTALMRLAGDPSKHLCIKSLLRHGAEVTSEGPAYDKLSRFAKEELTALKGLYEYIDNSLVDQEVRDADKSDIKSFVSSKVFSPDMWGMAKDLAEPGSREFVDESIRAGVELHSRIQNYDKDTKDFVTKNSYLIDDSLVGTKPKEWDVEALGAQKALVNLAALHGDKLSGVWQLKDASAKRVKSFIDSIPEEKGELLSHSPAFQELKVISKGGVGFVKDIQNKIAEFLPAGSINLSSSSSRAPQPASRRGDVGPGPKSSRGGDDGKPGPKSSRGRADGGMGR